MFCSIAYKITSAFSLLCLEADNHELFHSFLSGQRYFECAQSTPLYFHVRRWVIMFSGSIRALCANKLFGRFQRPWCMIPGFTIEV